MDAIVGPGGFLGKLPSGFSRGTRRANLVPGSDDLTVSPWINYGTPVAVTAETVDVPAGSSKATVITSDASFEGRFQAAALLLAGQQYRASIWAKGAVGGESIAFTDFFGAGGPVGPISAGWAQYSQTFTALDTRVAVLVVTAGDTVKFARYQVTQL